MDDKDKKMHFRILFFNLFKMYQKIEDRKIKSRKLELILYYYYTKYILTVAILFFIALVFLSHYTDNLKLILASLTLGTIIIFGSSFYFNAVKKCKKENLNIYGGINGYLSFKKQELEIKKFENFDFYQMGVLAIYYERISQKMTENELEQFVTILSKEHQDIYKKMRRNYKKTLNSRIYDSINEKILAFEERENFKIEDRTDDCIIYVEIKKQ